MDLQQYQERYAEVLVKIGVQLKEGQTLCVEAPIEQKQFVALLAQAAYRAGCGEFGVIWHFCDSAAERKPACLPPDICEER